MNQKSKLSFIKNNVYNMILENQDILRALYYVDSTKNPFDDKLENIDESKLDILEEKKIISKHRTVDMVNEHAQCSLSMEIGRVSRRDLRDYKSSLFYKNAEIVFYILCNNGIMDLPNGDDRVIAIEEFLEEMFHYQDIGALGYKGEIVESGKYNCKDGFTARYVVLRLCEKTTALGGK